MSHTRSISLIIITVVFSALAGAGGFLVSSRINQAPIPAPATRQTTVDSTVPRDGGRLETAGKPEALQEESGHNEKQTQEGVDQVDSHEHGAELSDLDRPVDEMWAASCEHDIPQYQCDECRYEIGIVKINADLIGNNGLLNTGFPEKRQGRHEERNLPGEVQLDETRTVHVASPLTGLITRGFTTPEAKVEAGAPLFEVDSPEVAEAKGSYLKAIAGLDLAVKAANRETLLFSRKVAAEVEVQEAEAKRTAAETDVAAARGRLLRLGLTKSEIKDISAKNGAAALSGLVIVRASKAGTVIEGHATPGEHVETGKELLTISNLDSVWVMADLKDADLATVSNAAGAAAKIETLDRSFSGRLDTISGRMSEETRTAKARFSVDNADGLLKPGMFVSVRLLLPAAGESLVVPKIAVLADEGRPFVFTHKEGDYWVRRPVTLGARFDGMVEITSGITTEQRIITDGSFLLKSDVLRGKMGAGCAD
jgi:cobalt-zinc-cadmium efflux system membrane fusion protein